MCIMVQGALVSSRWIKILSYKVDYTYSVKVHHGFMELLPMTITVTNIWIKAVILPFDRDLNCCGRLFFCLIKRCLFVP